MNISVYFGLLMELYSDLDLDNDIKYVKTAINKYADFYKKIEQSVHCANKVFASRLCFICFQFRNIFDRSLWL